MEFARSLPTPELSDGAKEDIATIKTFWHEALAAHGGEGTVIAREELEGLCLFAFRPRPHGAF